MVGAPQDARAVAQSDAVGDLAPIDKGVAALQRREKDLGVEEGGREGEEGSVMGWLLHSLRNARHCLRGR